MTQEDGDVSTESREDGRQPNKPSERQSQDGPGVCVVTFRGKETPQNATYLLLNVLSALTEVSLVTTALAESSKIQGEYTVTETAHTTKGGSFLSTLSRFLSNQLRVCNAVRKTDASVVYFFGGQAYVVPILYSRLIGRKVLVQPRGDVALTLRMEWKKDMSDVVAMVLYSLVRLLEMTGYYLSHGVVTYTPSMASELGVSRFRDKLYAYGTRYIKVDEFRPEKSFEDREDRIGFVGRLDTEKGIDVLVEAVKNLDPEIKFRFVGDGDYREDVERELSDEIEEGRVEMEGWVEHDEIPENLNDLRLVVMPSSPTEGLPTSIQEAFGCGTPVYATPVSGIPDVVREGETGFLMESKDPEKIARRIEEILERDDLTEISRRCRELCVERYSYRASVEGFGKILSDVLSKG
ncbi:MAG: glycosyltransferase family 4 protein [Halobacteria archaeon]